MSDKQETDNLSIEDQFADSPGAPVQNADDSADFFAALDKNVNGMTYDSVQSNEPDAPVIAEAQAETSQAQPESPAPQQNHNWEKRYKDSSKEAKNLQSRLSELEPYTPVLDAMKEDPQLINHVRDYFEGGGSAPVNLKERLGVPEDFVFDYDEAISNSNSDSARVLGATIDGVVQQRLSAFANEQQAQNQIVNEETSFKSRHELSDDQMGEVLNFAKSRKLSLDDIYYLYNRENRDKNIANSARKEVTEQMKNVRQKPKSVSTAGSQTVEQSTDDLIFDQVASQGAGVEELFR